MNAAPQPTEAAGSPSQPNVSPTATPSAQMGMGATENPAQADYNEFYAQYLQSHPDANMREAALAYQQHNREAEARAQSRTEREPGYGVLRDEFSARVDAETVEAIDALAKLFRLKIRFADLGENNGLYNASLEEIALDISPVHSGADNAFLFAVAHEIGHAIKARTGAEIWAAFERYAIQAKGGDAAVSAKQSSHSVYSALETAREEVACDFIGELLSDRAALKEFCAAIQSGEVQTEHARGIVAAFRSVIGRLRGKNAGQNDSAAAALVARVQEHFGTDIETAENAVREMQRAVAAAIHATSNTQNGQNSSVEPKKSAKDMPYSGMDSGRSLGYNEEYTDEGRRKSDGQAGGTGAEAGVRGASAVLEDNAAGTNRRRLDESNYRRGDQAERTGGGRPGVQVFQQATAEALSPYQRERIEEILYPPFDNSEEWRLFLRQNPNVDIVSRVLNLLQTDPQELLLLANTIPRLDVAIREVTAFLKKNQANAPQPKPAGVRGDASDSTQTDSEGNYLSKAQEAYYRKSKFRDSDGNLLALYHGSRTGAFSVFDLFRGIWLTPDRSYAESYAEFRDTGESLSQEVYTGNDLKLYKVYANSVNPANLGELERPLTREKIREFAHVLHVEEQELVNRWNDFVGVSSFELTRTEEFIDLARSKGFDGFTATESGVPTYCVFQNENQVALTTNRTPTDHPDIRYSKKDISGNKTADVNTAEAEQADRTGTKQDARPARQAAPQAQKKLQRSVSQLFSIRPDARAEVAEVLDAVSNKLAHGEALTDLEREDLLSTLYENARFSVYSDEYYSDFRSTVQNSRVYVPESIRAEFGDDWNSFRQRAFANRIYLTNNPRDVGIDVWAAELAERYPALETGYDLSAQLDAILDLAEHGRAEQLSFDEMAERTEAMEGWSVAEQRAELERQLDLMLESFAAAAESEIADRLIKTARQLETDAKRSAEAAETARQAVADNIAKQRARQLKERVDRALTSPKKATSQEFLREGTAELKERVKSIEAALQQAREQAKSFPLLPAERLAALTGRGVRLAQHGIFDFTRDVMREAGAPSLAQTDVKRTADQVTAAFTEAAEISNLLDMESAAAYLWNTADSLADAISPNADQAEHATLRAQIGSSLLDRFAQANQNAKVQQVLDRTVSRAKAHLKEQRNALNAQRAKAVAEAAKTQAAQAAQADAATERIVAWYEKELDKVTREHNNRIDAILRRAARNEHKAAMEAALTQRDADARRARRTAKQTDALIERLNAEHFREVAALDRKSRRQIEHILRDRDGAIARMEQRALTLALRKSPDGQAALRAMRAVREDTGRDETILTPEQIATQIRSAKELSEMSKAKRDGLVKRTYDLLYRGFVSDTLELERFSNLQERADNAGTKVTAYRNRGAMVEAIQQRALFDREGNIIDERSLAEVAVCWENDRVGKKVDTAAQDLFEQYLYNMHGADRMSIEEKARGKMEAFYAEHPEYASAAKPIPQTEVLRRAAAGDTVAQEYIELSKQFAAAKNKPVFGDENGNVVNATTHRAIASDIAAANPWVVEKANTLYEWWDKFMQAWVVGTELSADQYQTMQQLYPHYVPTYRAFEKGDRGVFVTGRDGITVKRSIRKATGSTMDLMSVDDNLAAQVARIVENTRFNELALNIADEVIGGEETSLKFADYAVFLPFLDEKAVDFRAQDLDSVSDELQRIGRIEKTGQSVRLTAWSNGEPISVNISTGMYQSLQALTGADIGEVERGILRLGNALTGPMKTAITGVNPIFAFRNVPRDVALAGVNSVAGLAFGKYLVKAVHKMASNDVMWQQFKALGGSGASYYAAESGFVKSLKNGNIASKAVQKLGAFNEATEAMTRFAEYVATIERFGDTPENRARAIKNAAEVTVDFSRHGRYGKILNAWIPYYNPGIQGLDRLLRSVFQNEGVKGAIRTIGRGAVTSVLPNALMIALLYAVVAYDDWDKLDDRTKDAYYTIPIGNGRFIKVAKSREWAQLIGNPLMRAWQGLNGREDPFAHYWDTSIAPNFLPDTPLDAIGVSQAIDLLTNKDFAGRTIVPYDYQNVSAAEQYDEATSIVARAIGKVLKLSPMQIDYIIGDYFGDFGDIFIEATNTASAADNFGEYALEIFTSPFIADNAFSSRISTEYYEMLDELDQTCADLELRKPDNYQDSIAYQARKALNAHYGTRISELSKASRESDDAESQRAQRLEMQALQQEALDFYERCLSGEIKDPVRYLDYAPYGDTIRNELIRLKKYEGSEYDYVFVPKADAPQIGKHKNTDAEKEAYEEIYIEQYSSVVGGVISSASYQKATDEEKLSLLENARSLAYYYAKRDWAEKFGIKSDTYDPGTEKNKYAVLIQAGFDFFGAYSVEQKYRAISSDQTLNTPSLKATAYAEWVDSHAGWTSRQKTAARDAYKITQTVVVDPEKYDQLTELGLNPEDAQFVVSEIADLQPLPEKETVTPAQKFDAIIGMGLPDEDTFSALYAYTSGEDAKEKVRKVEAAGIPAYVYVDYRNARTTYGYEQPKENASWSQERLRSWLNSQDLTQAQKAVLWEITNSSDSWQRNNPYR